MENNLMTYLFNQEQEIKNDIGNPIPVIISGDVGELHSFNNHALATHRGWVMDDVMRPMVSIRVNPTGTTSNNLMQIVEYIIGNNNASQSTIMYEWYEGDLTISGATIPNWTNINSSSYAQYRIYQDKYSTNVGNTFTIPNGTVMRHSGIIIGKNIEGDEIDKPLTGGIDGKMLTLCVKRLDNATEIDVWFAFTIKE
jgi:hypothetical protein